MIPETIFSISARRMLRLLLAIVLFCTTGLPLRAQVPFTCQDQFFLTLTNNSFASLNEVIIDPQTNAVVFSGINNNVIFPVNAAGYRFTDNFIYCINPENRGLIRLDANGNAQLLKILPLNPNLAYFAGDITPDGRYLIVMGTLSLPTGVGVAADLVRIDLESPNFDVQIIPVNTSAQIFDIAFHPVTDELYGFDSNAQRLVRINPNTGVVTTPFPQLGAPALTGALFFDAYGNLFAYGSPNGMSDQNTLYRINPLTGLSTFLTRGASASSSDGCSCPYTVELTKTVVPEEAPPCTEVEYIFDIVNTSRRPHLGMRFEDRLPPGFTFVRVSANPLNGNVLSQEGDNFFLMDNFELPVGRFEIRIIVNTGTVASGRYRNQAILYNLPESLGGKRVSDNPKTLADDDSTDIVIRTLPAQNLIVPRALCDGAAITLDGAAYNGGIGSGVKYFWPNGSTSSTLNVQTPGTYQLMMAYGCDTAYVDFEVELSSIRVALTPNFYEIELGDSLFLSSSVFNTSGETLYTWTDPEPGSIRCNNCPESWAQPLNNLEYLLTVANSLGCQDTAIALVRVNKNKNVYFPNVFKPGASSENGFFYPFGATYATIRRLRIYSRWGEQMFETFNAPLNEPLSGWDGFFRGKEAMPGVYTWYADIEFLDGSSSFFEGDVTVVR